MSTLITVIHTITCCLIVLVVLMQSGKGAEISATFGGSSQTVFGSSGGANFFTKLTFTLAAIFMATSLTLTLMSAKSRQSVFDGQIAPPPIEAKAKTDATAPIAPDAAKATETPVSTTPATSATSAKH